MGDPHIRPTPSQNQTHSLRLTSHNQTNLILPYLPPNQAYRHTLYTTFSTSCSSVRACSIDQRLNNVRFSFRCCLIRSQISKFFSTSDWMPDDDQPRLDWYCLPIQPSPTASLTSNPIAGLHVWEVHYKTFSSPEKYRISLVVKFRVERAESFNHFWLFQIKIEFSRTYWNSRIV